MPSSTHYSPGDIVLVAFKFADQIGFKRRPALILSSSAYHASRQDTIMMALTTQAANRVGDCSLLDWADAGLPRPTNAKAVVQTIERTGIERWLGHVSNRDFERVRDSLRVVLEL